MRRTTTITAVTLIAALALAGCGGSDDDKKSASGGNGGSGGDYCATMKSTAEDIKGFTADGATPDFDKFDDFVAIAQDLADEAPAEIKDEWKLLSGAMDDLVSALTDAGLTIQDMVTAMATGQLPEGVDAAKLQELGTKLQGLTSEQLEKANEAITKHAEDVCKVDLTEAP